MAVQFSEKQIDKQESDICFKSSIISGIYTGVESEMFSAGELFTALALFNQLAVCLSVFPVTVPIFIKGFVSRNRWVLINA